MSRDSIGYFEGTDSDLLTGLVCIGYDTIPVSNGYDGHGRFIGSVNERRRFGLLIGYLHKIFAPEGEEITFQDVFHVCRIYEIPLLLEVPREQHELVPEILGELPEFVTLVDPKEALETARKILDR